MIFMSHKFVHLTDSLSFRVFVQHDNGRVVLSIVLSW